MTQWAPSMVPSNESLSLGAVMLVRPGVRKGLFDGLMVAPEQRMDRWCFR